MRRSATALIALVSIIAFAVVGAVAEEASVPDSTTAITALQGDIPEYPLKPADTSSPRATLQGFLDNMNRSYQALMAADRENKRASGLFASESARRKSRQAERLLRRATGCLDLSEVPSSLRLEAGYEAAIGLKEILDRIDLPPIDQIPDADAIEKLADERGMSAASRWWVPNTDIVIARVEDGPREGEYLFTTRTIAHLDAFYNAVRTLPYKSDDLTTPGFLEFFLGTPGRLIPPKWDKWLPAWSKRVYLSGTIWQWCAIPILLLIWFVVVRIAFRSLVARAGARSSAGRAWRRAFFCLTTILALLIVHIIMREQINVTGSLRIALRVLLTPVWWSLAAAMTFFVSTALAETIIESPRIDPQGIQASYFRALFTILGFVAASVIFLVGLSRIGVSLIPLLTGLGIGGLAVALAARPTLESIISSFTIFADKPYQVGERIHVMGNIGTVESIGIRSTRIRLLNGHLTIVPNEKMATLEVENIGRRPHIRRTFNITIIYGTPPEKINQAVDILRDTLAVPDGSDSAHPNAAINQPDFPPRVFFNEFNSDSLNIYVSYWFHPPDYWTYMAHAHGVNIQIKGRFNAEGIDFAFPTQTVHLAGGENRLLNDSSAH